MKLVEENDAPDDVEASVPNVVSSSVSKKVLAAPATRRLSRELGVDLTVVVAEQLVADSTALVELDAERVALDVVSIVDVALHVVIKHVVAVLLKSMIFVQQHQPVAVVVE